MIWKIVAYDNFHGMCMTVARKPDEFVPNTFMYNLPDNADRNKHATLTFLKRSQIVAQMEFGLLESKGETILALPNIIEFTNSHDMVNLFQLHIQSDTIVFNYTTKNGQVEDFKFPLAGFKEKYLEQFI